MGRVEEGETWGSAKGTPGKSELTKPADLAKGSGFGATGKIWKACYLEKLNDPGENSWWWTLWWSPSKTMAHL